MISMLLPIILHAQENALFPRERVKLSGQVMLMSATNSNLTGGYYSLSPAVRGQVTASYRNFALTAMRNSDLINWESAANITLIAPAYSRVFGAFVMTVSAETYLFDQRSDLSLIAPGVLVLRKGVVNVDANVLYGIGFNGKNVFSQRLSISKDYAGYTFKLTGWNVYWNTHRTALAVEVSTKLTDRVRFTVIGNLNRIIDTKTTQKFGVVRIGYSF